MRRQLGTAVSGTLLAIALTVATAGCSGADETTATTSAATASVTQSAPSVWSPPETVAGTTATSAEDAAASADPLASSVTALPGLSTLCTAAIHAQAAVNELFAAGLASPPAAVETSSGGAEGAVGLDTLVAATTSAPPAASAEKTTPPPTTADVQSLFDKIGPQIPASLAAAFGTLKEASLKIVHKSADAVSEILAQPDVTGAMQSVSEYIAACKPTTTQ